ncbi:hypothetical protein SLS62_009687 [Diatrype stigma]|uniref:Rhodopsin domain-containing protein n=1 Tax=Diatrype stigma TaxID=117547 RepID=A0AAN9UD12_9PEZI
MASSLSPFLLELTGRASPSGTFQGTPPAELPAENGVHVWHVAIVTLLMCIAHAGLMANATHNGMGLHVWQYDAELNARYYLWIGISSEFYVLGLCGFKCALILQYLQLFGVNSRFRWACYGLLFFCVGYLFCNLMTEFLGCTPIAKKWEPNLPGHCINSVATNSFYGACSMASDLAIAILPLTMIWRLQFQSKRQKLGLSLVLSCGFVLVSLYPGRSSTGASS